MGFEIVTLSFKGNNSEDSIRNFKIRENFCVIPDLSTQRKVEVKKR